ncbi:helix-turn-helix domain-containing protein [Ottowia testudinis]|uniref:Helix-turn-helix domain-containing protein n=1 Tax=Ottowia testudinis TaxID=2816950 RepID=A0A975CGV2_9BURK|nr:helix-turn-helix domain-containing protein [Ottowia testudinis]QTD45537.1 helix-turn-helix domain-containing protein [Ottowia testudinis]
MPALAPTLTPDAATLIQALGATVRTQRKSLRVSATALAEAAGVSRVTVYRIEKGEPSVTLGAYANVLAALGLGLKVSTGSNDAASTAPPGWLPARVRLANYPQLRALAWHVPGADALSPAQAWSLYQRNARHLDAGALTPVERQLMQALQQAFADDVAPPDPSDGV